MAHLRIGSCSFSYPSWAGLVYSAPRGINFLAEYAQRYDTVEVDQWFWSLFPPHPPKLPDPATVQNYAASVGPEFRFTIKAPNSLTLTHNSEKQSRGDGSPNSHFLSLELYHRFLNSIEPLLPLTGAIILQFEYLNKQKMPNAEAFFERLGAFLAQAQRPAPLTIELRNPNYYGPQFVEFCARHGVGPALCQGYYLPDLVQAVGIMGLPSSGARPPVVLRLIGPDRAAMDRSSGKRWDRIIVARDADLERVVTFSQATVQRGHDVYLNVNNHYEGSAPLTIEKISALAYPA
ncbi:MAG: DUF72 domain-containing protein [Spirochaetia bacterium]